MHTEMKRTMHRNCQKRLTNSGQTKKRKKHRLITLDMKQVIIIVSSLIQKIIEGCLKMYIKKQII